MRGGYGIFYRFLGERRGDVIQPGFQRDNNFIPASTAQPANHVRVMPLRFSWVRHAPMDNWDFSIIKNTKVAEGKNIQFKFEALNAFNHPLYNNATRTVNTAPSNTAFGSSVGQNAGNYSRRFQFGLKFLF